MCQSPALSDVIQHSDHLFLENTTAVWGHRFSKLNFNNPINNSIDLTLYDKAVQKHIPVDSLETISDEIKAITQGVTLGQLASYVANYVADSAKSWVVNYVKDIVKDITQDKQPTAIKALKALFGIYHVKKICQKEWEFLNGMFNPPEASKLEKMQEKMQEIALINLWQGGDISMLAQLPNNEALIDDRNKKWLNDKGDQEGILSKLKNAKESLCFAFGSGHLAIGPSSILDAILKTEGLKVERGIYNYEEAKMEWEKQKSIRKLST